MANNFSNFYNTLHNIAQNNDDTLDVDKNADRGQNQKKTQENDELSKTVDKSDLGAKSGTGDQTSDNTEKQGKNDQKTGKNNAIPLISAPLVVHNNKSLTLNKKQQDNINTPEINAENENTENNENISSRVLTKKVFKPIWLSVSESAKLGGVAQKTIRRAITAKQLKYKIVKDRYLIDLASVIVFLHANTKLKNKLNFNGIGQYVDIWRG